MSGLLKKKSKAPTAPASETVTAKRETAAEISDRLQAEKEAAAAAAAAPPPRVTKPTKLPSEKFIAEKKREERLQREESRAEAEEIAESQRLQRRKRLRRTGGMRMLFSPLRREGPGFGRRSLLGG